MDINFFSDPQVAPKPRDDIRIESLVGSVLPDGNRLSVDLQLTPFLPADKPSLAIEIRTPSGHLLSSAHIIESVHAQIHITLHLPHPFDADNLILQAHLYFAERAPQASLSQSISLNSNPHPLDE